MEVKVLGSFPLWSVNAMSSLNIYPVSFSKYGKIYEKLNDFTQALSNYQAIIDNHKESIYVDEAYFFAAEIYVQTGNIEAAKPLYEYVIMNKVDSIYFVEAQKKYRKLRGDSI